jgi:uncharacterized membrane protein YcaP (DUF421 family)
MRVIGRHEFGQLTPFNIILLLIISESISESLSAGDTSLIAGLISASTLLGLSVLLSVGQYKSRRIREITSPSALTVIEEGRIIEQSLRREVMTREDLSERLALFECSSSGPRTFGAHVRFRSRLETLRVSRTPAFRQSPVEDA